MPSTQRKSQRAGLKHPASGAGERFEGRVWTSVEEDSSMSAYEERQTIYLISKPMDFDFHRGRHRDAKIIPPSVAARSSLRIVSSEFCSR